ncbi:hypothetical protein NCS56_01507100 [Fusarium sp. Ph1]|nr:hypothetical protein NCS56_01507100 [Fusarium sp. Ph1]
MQAPLNCPTARWMVDSGSPRVKIRGIYLEPQEVTTLPEYYRLNSLRDNSPMKLPSLGEFDEGVEALIQKHGPTGSWAPPSPLPGFSGNPTVPQSLKSLNLSEPAWPFREFPSENSATDGCASRRGTITSFDQYTLTGGHARQSLQSNCGPFSSYNNPHGKKYTTEEGDLIIYAWHDKKMKRQRIKQEFAARFGRIPERTVQGLRAWYYRMNLRIPIWDQDGWLCFDNEDDLEPRHKLGLAQQYPERAVKLKAQDWARKRAPQYRERREWRQRKQQRAWKIFCQ